MFKPKYLIITLVIFLGCASSKSTQVGRCDENWHTKQPEKQFDLGKGANINVTVLDASDMKPLQTVEVGTNRNQFLYKTNQIGNALIDKSSVSTKIDTVYIRLIGFDLASVPISKPEIDSLVVLLDPCSGPPFSPTAKEY